MQEIKELPAKSKRFALVVGVDEYQDEQISRLSGAGNDAKALAERTGALRRLPADQVILLASDQPQQRQPNRGNILQYLSNLRGIVPEDGLLVVSFCWPRSGTRRSRHSRGSGAWTTGMKTTMVRRRMEGPGKRRAIRDTGCCAAARGRRCRRLPLGGSLQVFPGPPQPQPRVSGCSGCADSLALCPLALGERACDLTAI